MTHAFREEYILMKLQRAGRKGEVKVQRAQDQECSWGSGAVHYCMASFQRPAVPSQVKPKDEGRFDQWENQGALPCFPGDVFEIKSFTVLL